MGMRLQKRIKIFPGVVLNINWSTLFKKGAGPSLTFGVPGLGINVNRNGTQGYAGAPGTGLSYRTGRKKSKSMLGRLLGWLRLTK